MRSWRRKEKCEANNKKRQAYIHTYILQELGIAREQLEIDQQGCGDRVKGSVLLVVVIIITIILEVAAEAEAAAVAAADQLV